MSMGDERDGEQQHGECVQVGELVLQRRRWNVRDSVVSGALFLLYMGLLWLADPTGFDGAQRAVAKYVATGVLLGGLVGVMWAHASMCAERGTLRIRALRVGGGVKYEMSVQGPPWLAADTDGRWRGVRARFAGVGPWLLAWLVICYAAFAAWLFRELQGFELAGEMALLGFAAVTASTLLLRGTLEPGLFFRESVSMLLRNGRPWVYADGPWRVEDATGPFVGSSFVAVAGSRLGILEALTTGEGERWS